MTNGKKAYALDCERQPYYIGSHIKRRSWEDLVDYERATWERNPTARDYNGLRRWRKARGLTQEQAAYMLGISPRHIGRIETGTRLLTPTLERLMAML